VRAASTRLAEAMSVDPAAPPEASGVLEPPSGEVPALSVLTESAQGIRVELKVIDQALAAAQARRAAAEAEAVPDLTVSLSFGREANTETLVGGGLSMPIPLFNTNQGPIAEASAAAARLEAEKGAIKYRIQQEVAAAVAELQTAIEVEQALRGQVLQPLDTASVCSNGPSSRARSPARKCLFCEVNSVNRGWSG
jgi:outer membrane protein TolC